MPPSIQQDWQGPDFPLGFIAVPTPGTPVNIMFNVDPSNKQNPSTADPPTAGFEFPVIAMNMLIQALKPTAGGHPTQANAGNIYLVRTGVQGTGNRDDPGATIFTLSNSQTLPQFLFPSAGIKFSPYRYFLDADNANDGAFITLFLPA